MRGFGFIVSLIVVATGLFLASGVFTYYAGDVYWATDRAGFPTGFIHGAIAPVIIVVGVFSDYGIYEVNNSGWFYDLFFILGILFVWAGGSGGTKNVIQNYYHHPDSQSQPAQSSGRLHKDDLKELSKMVDKKISKKIKRRKVKKKRNWFSGWFKKGKEKKGLKKTILKEEEVKKPIKVKK